MQTEHTPVNGKIYVFFERGIMLVSGDDAALLLVRGFPLVVASRDPLADWTAAQGEDADIMAFF